MELRSERDEQGGQWTAGNIKGGTLRFTLSIQYTAHKTTLNAALALETLVLKIKNGERVYKFCIVLYVLFDRWIT